MTTAPVSLQDLRRRLYVKAKAEKGWRCRGLYVHVCKVETLRAAYDVAKRLTVIQVPPCCGAAAW